MSSTPQSLIKRLLEGLSVCPDPVFRADELHSAWPDDTELFVRAGILRRSTKGDWHELDGHGQKKVLLANGKTYLVDPTMPGTAPILVEEADLSRLKLDETRFATWIAETNCLTGKREFCDSLWTLGATSHGGWDTQVFYVCSRGKDRATSDLMVLSERIAKGRAIIVLAPSLSWIPANAIQAFENRRVIVADLAPLVRGTALDLKTIVLPPFDRKDSEVSNLDVIRHLDKRLDTLGVEVSDLKQENETLKQKLAGHLVAVGRKVEMEFFHWIIVILATGSVNAASKKLGIPNSSFDEKLKRYVAKGGLYRTLYGLLDIRRKGVGIKGIEHFNEEFGEHQMGRDLSADASILRDLLDGLEQQNKDNWPTVRKELIEMVKDELPER